MKLSDLIEKKDDVGTYAGLRFSDSSNDAIINLVKLLKLPNPIKKDEIHMTLLYSRKYLPNYKPLGIIPEDVSGIPFEFHVFDTFDKKRALVLKLDCTWAINRHNELMNTHKASYDYPEYIPHLTLSYDIGDLEIPEFKNIPMELQIVREYSEDLNLEWKPK